MRKSYIIDMWYRPKLRLSRHQDYCSDFIIQLILQFNFSNNVYWPRGNYISIDNPNLFFLHWRKKVSFESCILKNIPAPLRNFKMRSASIIIDLKIDERFYVLIILIFVLMLQVINIRWNSGTEGKNAELLIFFITIKFRMLL